MERMPFLWKECHFFSKIFGNVQFVYSIKTNKIKLKQQIKYPFLTELCHRGTVGVFKVNRL
jgi:hypothetical protein